MFTVPRLWSTLTPWSGSKVLTMRFLNWVFQSVIDRCALSP